MFGDSSSSDPSRFSHLTHLIAVGTEITRKKNVNVPKTNWPEMSCCEKPANPMTRKVTTVIMLDRIMAKMIDRKIIMTPSAKPDFFWSLRLTVVGITLLA